MTKTSTLSKRFADLLLQLDAVAATRHYVEGSFISGDYVDSQKLTNWRIKARNLLSMACGENSEHYKEFVKAEGGSPYSTNHDIMLQLRAIFEAAQEDYDGGFLASVRSIVQAELFDNELDQARELLRSGFTAAAAVVAGVVLETTLRQLCVDSGLPLGKLDKMNSDLARAGRYTVLVQKRITTLADIRNNAAHGNRQGFAKRDVQEMIEQVEGVVTDHL